MPEYLILKREGEDPLPRTVAIISCDGGATDALPQGYQGDGRYVVVDWGERVEADLAPGPVEVNAVEDRAARDEAAAAVGQVDEKPAE